MSAHVAHVARVPSICNAVRSVSSKRPGHSSSATEKGEGGAGMAVDFLRQIRLNPRQVRQYTVGEGGGRI